MFYDLMDLEVPYDFDETPLDPMAEGSGSAEDALIASVNQRGCVDLAFMQQYSGLTVQALIDKLGGHAIFQDPAVFVDDDTWQPEKGWVLRAPYLSGVLPEKLAVAKEMNRRFPGRFRKNVELLRALLPAKLRLGDIYVGLGAAWVPPEIYAQFVQELLALHTRPAVSFSKELAAWKIEAPEEAKKSVRNTLTYGTVQLSAVKIIEKTMNAATVKIFDSVPRGFYGGKQHYEYILNERATLAAQEKQNAILKAFQAWIGAEKSRVQRLQDCYNKAFVGCHSAAYDDIALTLPGLNPAVELKPHQKAAVARILLSGENTLLSHEVGTGKTYIMIVAAHELKRLGLAKKTLIVVPNNVLQSTVDAHRLLYRDDPIRVIYPNDFTRADRNRVLRQLRDEESTAVYMAYSSFDMVSMSKDYWIRKKLSEIRKLRQAADLAAPAQRKKMNARAERLSAQLEKYRDTTPVKPWLPFEDLGIDTLFLDEAHNYKNIPLFSRTDNIVGMHPGGSAKCAELLEKTRCVSRVVFATGTPLTNSLSDLFVLQSYLQPELLRFHAIDTFDAWINVFGERETNYEIDVDAKNLRPVTRFSSFHNLDELMHMFSLVCDYHEADPNEAELPRFGGYRDIVTERSMMTGLYINDLSRRTDDVRAHRVTRKEDNLLKITGDGHKCAMDIRMVDAALWDETDKTPTKISVCAANVFRFYREYPGTSQIVFSDIGTPKASFNVYDELKRILTEDYGVPAAQIAFIHDAATESARAKLFAAMNAGTVRIVVGSTAKLGMGVNVQERLIAIHHLSIPWKPSDVVQRNGRILRPGNRCEEAFILRYTTRATFDSYSWQLLENKQRFISDFLSGISATRDVSDIADAVLSYSEIKALTIGDPRIKARVQTSNKLERAKLASRQRQEQLVQLRGLLESLPAQLQSLERLLAAAEADRKLYQAEKSVIPIDERLAFGEELLEALAENVQTEADRVFDDYQGFSVVLPAQMQAESAYVLLRSINGGNYYIDMKDCDKPRGCSSRMDYLLEHLPERIDTLQSRIAQVQQQIAEAKADLKTGNPYAEQIRALTEQLSQIDAALAEDQNKEKKAS